MFKNFILPSAFLAAMIIGAGVFALPFIFSVAGLPVGFFYLAFFGTVFAVIHLLYADIIFRTSGERHRFVGYAKIYLGKAGFFVSVFTTAIGLVLALTIYLVLSASFLNLVFPAIDAFQAILIFWLVASSFIFLKIENLANSEVLVAASMLAIIFVVFLFGWFSGEANIAYAEINYAYFLLPFGPVLFALAGRPAISFIVDYFDHNQLPAAAIKKPIIVGTLVPAAVYLLFVLGILKISPTISGDAVSGLIGYLPASFLVAIGLFGLFSLWSSYTIISREVEGIFALDFHLPLSIALIATVFLPLILYFAGLQNFLVLVAAAGGIFLALESILVVLMWRALGKRAIPPLLVRRVSAPVLFGIILIFMGGMLYEILNLL